jgi:Tol biopolymer transport system component
MPPLAEWVNLAFSSYRDNNWEVYTSNADGANQARRTVNPAYDSTPKFNRGANRIAFVSDRDGNYEIYTMNTDGSNVARLTNTSANEYLPTWSPDGSKVAFYSYRDGNAEIYVMNADGSNQTRLTSNAAWDGHPAWSPDGAQLVFVSERSGLDDLWVMNAGGSNQHQLTSGFNTAYPDWSPDGSRIIFNDDTNNDGWLEVAIINADGSNLVHPLGYSPANYDYASPSWSPTGQEYAFAKIQWTYYQGNYYWVDAYLYGVSTGSIYQLTNSGRDWWPDWQTTDVSAPSSSVTTSAWSGTITFPVQWNGKDTGNAGVASYDLQYRDGANGTWTRWFTATNQTAATFTGQYGHTYYFRSRARDYANNLEAYPSVPDAMTTIYQHAASGQVFDNREQPIAVVNVQPDPAALNTGVSRHDGTYDLYFASGGIYTLTMTRNNFSELPPLLNVTVPSSNSLSTLYLPPLDNQIDDSHFESGDLSAWNPNGDLTPTITSTAHTGNYAAVLGGSVPSDTLTTGPWYSTFEQMINISPTIGSGTLSLLYRVESADPLSDTLTVYVVGANNTLTFTLPVTATEWTHAWFDLSTWIEPTATLKLDFAVTDVGRTAEVVVDEVTWGSVIEGSHAVFLPLVRR